MKATYLLKAFAMAVLVAGSAMSTNLMAQEESKFITNQTVENDLVTSETIFRQDNGYLYNHMRYDFTYDEQNRMTGKTASKWDGAIEEWIPYFQITYQYGDNEIIMNFARWNEQHKAYDKDTQQSVLELNEENMPVASL